MTQTTGTSPDSQRLLAIGLMLIATLCFSGMQGSIRYIAMDGSIHPFEIVFFRNLFGLIVILPWFVRYGWLPLRTKRLGFHVARGVLNLGSMICFFTALSMSPLVDVAALIFAAPLFATVFAVFLFREKVGLRRWSAILLGFAGTVVVLRPGVAEVSTGQLLALTSALTWGVALMFIKSLAKTESAITITTYMIVLLAPMSLIPALFHWVWPSWTQLAWLVAIGMMGTLGHLLLNQALKMAETNVVMPMDFARLIWVTIIGYFAFTEIPDLFTWTGGAMIFASVIYIAYRENRLRQQRAQGAKSPASRPV